MTSVSVPATQKAWRILRRGHPRDVVKLETIPVPTLKPGQALVKVEAAALNPVGWKIMLLAPNFLIKRPRTAEHDFAGTVVNPGTTSFSEGEKVYGWISGFPKDGQGSLAQYIAVTEDQAARWPTDKLSLEQAAGAGLVGMTAYVGLFEVAGVQEGQSVFVNGGSTAVGITAIQMLKAKGCRVTASCSAKNVEFVKSLGADEVLDYTASPLHTQLIAHPPSPKFHAILDNVGSDDLYYHSEKYLAPGGVYSNAGFNFHGLRDIPGQFGSLFYKFVWPAWLGGVNRPIKGVPSGPTKERLVHLTEFFAKGSVVPKVDSVFAFADVLKAYERIQTGRAVGKVVVKVSPES